MGSRTHSKGENCDLTFLGRFKLNHQYFAPSRLLFIIVFFRVSKYACGYFFLITYSCICSDVWHSVMPKVSGVTAPLPLQIERMYGLQSFFVRSTLSPKENKQTQ
jgi:hypothetical protein